MEKDGDSEAVLTFKNTHDAISAEQALIKADIVPRVMPLPAQLGAGCGICLRIRRGECGGAVLRLAESGIRAAGLYELKNAWGRQVYAEIRAHSEPCERM